MRVKAVILAILLGTLSFTGYWLLAKPYEGLRREQNPFFFQAEAPTLPPISLTDADMIRILSNYNLMQQPSPVFCQQLYGLTSMTVKEIELCDKSDNAQKELTLLHELYHIRYHEVGIDTGGAYEPVIEKLAEVRFAQLYGVAGVAPPTAQ